jgi:hypothetical protein
MTYPLNLTPAQLAQYFPRTRPLIKDGVFELGLVLAGTVSAGSYTAGVLDYLLEALDAWQLAKERGDPDAPPHEVVISTVAGASGGSVNGAILLRAAGWQFPHGPDPANPFYSSWTSGVDLRKLLAPGPSASVAGFTSLLNCASIEAQAAATVAFVGQPLGSNGSPSHRSFLANPLRLFMTVGNLSGVPYTIQLAGETALSHALSSHGDYMRFALAVNQGVPNAPADRPDELALSPSVPPDANWPFLRDAALATCAFPIAFLSRQLARLATSAGYRVTVIPDAQGVGQVAQLVPNWEELLAGEPNPTQSNFLNVDGGAFNNEPLDLVRTALAGVDARNTRTASGADRAVIMIDPFSDPETLSRPSQGNILGVAGALISALLYQARFKVEDIALAYAEDVYSRYLIAPVGPGPNNQRTVGQRAIASGALGGFSGFVDPRFLDYDFRLGRYNAYSFLRQHFALPVTLPPMAADPAQPNNPIFRNWTADQLNNYAFANAQDPTDTRTYLPLIPLMRELRDNPPTLPPWPRLPAAPAWLPGAVEARLQSVYDMAKDTFGPESWWKKAVTNTYLGLGWSLYLRGALRDAVVNAINDGLRKQGLMP